MKNQILHIMVVLAFAMLFAGMQVSVFGQEIETNGAVEIQTEDFRGDIEGVWRTVVTPRNCLTGDAIPNVPPIRGLFTFHKGETMAEWGVPGGSNPALRSPGHGLWTRVRPGRNGFAFTFIFYRYDAGGVLLGSQKITASLELSPFGNTFASTSAIQLLDVNDNVIGTGCATAVGARFG